MIGQTNPNTLRIVEETVANLRQLENCIETLRVDIAGVCQSIGQPEAAHRILASSRAPAGQVPFGALHGGQIPFGAQSGQVPFSPQLAGNANPYANVSPFASVNPWATQSPWAAVNPWATQSLYSPASAYAQSPYTSPYAQQNLVSPQFSGAFQTPLVNQPPQF